MNDQAKVEALLDLELADLLRAGYWYLFSKWSNILTLAGLTLAGAVAALGFLLNDAAPAWYAWFALVMLLIPIALLATIYFQTRQNYSSLKEFQKRVRYTFSYDGYDVNDGKSSAHLSWDSILRAVETKHGFNLFLNKATFQTVPKRCFRQSSDIPLVREILRQSLGTKAQLKRV